MPRPYKRAMTNPADFRASGSPLARMCRDTFSRISFPASFRIIACASLFVSCAPDSRSAKPAETAFKSFDPPKGKALICVYRPSWPFTGLVKRPVSINKQLVATTGSGTFVAIPVDPGSYSVQAAAFTFEDTPESRAAYPEIKLRLAAGQTVFIRQTVDSLTSSGSSTMMLQTGGNPLPVPMGGGLLPYGAVIVDSATARSQCSGLKQVKVTNPGS
jgi:hypothetical protein